MTSKLKDDLLSYAISVNDESGSVTWETPKLFDKFPISAENMEFVVDEFKEKGFITGLHVGHTSASTLFVFSTTYLANEFLSSGGYQQSELNLKKQKQLDIDVSQAAIRSADASEVSATAAIKSAQEAKISRNIAIAALVISIIALVLQFAKS